MSLSLLALDLGAESGRAVLGKFDGRRLSLAELHRFTNRPAQLPDGLQWDILYLWGEILHSISAGAKQVEGQLDGLGLDSWGVDFGLLDSHDHLIGNPFHYRDGRTDGMMSLASEVVPRTEIYRQTGIQFMQINSLYQLFSMANSGSPALDSARTFMMIPDLVNFWLSGQKFCEFSNATTTQCFDPHKRDWASPLLNRLGVPIDLFPPIIMPGTKLGALSKQVASTTNAGKVLVIAPASHDTASAIAAVPARGTNSAWISSGTWSIVGVNVPYPVVNVKSFNYNLTNEGGVAGDYRLSKNVMGLWLLQECRRTWAEDGQLFDYGELVVLAERARPLRSIIDPDADEFLKPGDMPGRIRDYCLKTGQPLPEDIGAMIRCILDSIALKYRWVLEHLEELVGYRFDTVHIVGGGVRNQLLSQLTADAVGRTVVTGPVEATAIGNLLTQGIALSYLSSWDEAHEVVLDSFVVTRLTPRYDSAEWDSAYERLLAFILHDAREEYHPE